MQYQLTKKETEDLIEQSGFISHYQKIIKALQIELRLVTVASILSRLGLTLEEKQQVEFDFSAGTMTVSDKEKPEEKPEDESKK